MSTVGDEFGKMKQRQGASGGQNPAAIPADANTCELCGEPMPKGETMFRFHGYSGPCPKPKKLERPRHACGLEGYNPMRDDPCPACSATEPQCEVPQSPALSTPAEVRQEGGEREDVAILSEAAEVLDRCELFMPPTTVASQREMVRAIERAARRLSDPPRVEARGLDVALALEVADWIDDDLRWMARHEPRDRSLGIRHRDALHRLAAPTEGRQETPDLAKRLIASLAAASQGSEATPPVAENVADTCRNVTDDELTAFMKVVAAEAGDARPWSEIVADDEFAETTRWLRAALDNLLASRSSLPETASKDTARLDWLDRGAYATMDGGRERWTARVLVPHGVSAETLREAIDSAMSAPTPKAEVVNSTQSADAARSTEGRAQFIQQRDDVTKGETR